MKEFPVRLTYVRPRYDQRGRLNQPDDGDEDRVSSIFAKDGLYPFGCSGSHHNNTALEAHVHLQQEPPRPGQEGL